MGKWLLVWVPKQSRVSRFAVETLVNILVTAGGVFLASIVIPALFDRSSAAMLLLGGLLALVSWVGAVLLAWRMR